MPATFPYKFVARLKEARLKPAIFHLRVCGEIKRGASEEKYSPRTGLWRSSASKWRTRVSAASSGSEMVSDVTFSIPCITVQ
jgi:hypothetical protein